MSSSDGHQAIGEFGDVTIPSHLYSAVLTFLTDRCQNNKIHLAVAACEKKKILKGGLLSSSLGGGV